MREVRKQVSLRQFLFSFCSVVDDPKQKGKRQKGQPSGFLAPLQMSEALVKFFDTGESELSRSEVVKRLWKYIKENDLQVGFYAFIIITLKTIPMSPQIVREFCQLCM